MHTSMHPHMYTVNIHTHRHARARTHTRTRTRTCTHAHTHTHARTHAHTHTHTQHSGEALDTACKELKKMLRAVQSNIAQKDIPSVLLLLTVNMKKVIEQESTKCSASS